MAENDRVQRQMDFIVAQQAQFAADIEELKNLHKQAEQRMTKIEDVCLRLGNALVNLTDKVADIAVAQTNLDTRMGQLAASQKHTDQRLSALIDIVMQERNGKRSN